MPKKEAMISPLIGLVIAIVFTYCMHIAVKSWLLTTTSFIVLLHIELKLLFLECRKK